MAESRRYSLTPQLGELFSISGLSLILLLESLSSLLMICELVKLMVRVRF